MKHNSLLKLAGKLKLPVIEPDSRPWFYIVGKKYTVEWMNEDGSASCVYIIGNDKEDDIQTGYYAGFFAKMLKEVEKYLTM